MSSMGVKIDQFDVPVCNSFKAKVLNDQLCYEVDPNHFIERTNTLQYLKLGLILGLDFNEDRQTDEDRQTAEEVEKTAKPRNTMIEYQNMKVDSAKIFINSIGDPTLI